MSRKKKETVITAAAEAFGFAFADLLTTVFEIAQERTNGAAGPTTTAGAEPETPPITIDDVKLELVKVIEAADNPAAVKILQEVGGTKKASMLSEEFYPAVIEAAKKFVAEAETEADATG